MESVDERPTLKLMAYHCTSTKVPCQSQQFVMSLNNRWRGRLFSCMQSMSLRCGHYSCNVHMARTHVLFSGVVLCACVLREW